MIFPTNLEGKVSKRGYSGNALVESRQLSADRNNRPGHSSTRSQVSGQAGIVQALYGIVFVAILLSTCVAWDIVFSQQRHAEPNSDPYFTVVALPDTQYYTDQIRGAKFNMFTSQTQWIADNRTKENIRAVIGLGDIVDNGDVIAEWQKADAAYRILDRAEVPYAPVLGNHDYDDGDGLDEKGKRASASNYNAYFGPARFSPYSWYGGGFPQGSNENFYLAFKAGTRTYLVIGLEYYPRTDALEWAQRVVAGNQDKEVIIATHAYLDFDGTRLAKGRRHAPPIGLTSDNDANEIWAKLVRRNKNIILVMCGHVCQGISVMARKSDVGDNGNVVHQLLSDYQWFTDGGSGYMRIMRFRPSKRTIEVRTYSPYLNTYLTDATNEFVLKY